MNIARDSAIFKTYPSPSKPTEPMLSLADQYSLSMVQLYAPLDVLAEAAAAAAEAGSVEIAATSADVTGCSEPDPFCAEIATNRAEASASSTQSATAGTEGAAATMETFSAETTNAGADAAGAQATNAGSEAAIAEVPTVSAEVVAAITDAATIIASAVPLTAEAASDSAELATANAEASFARTEAAIASAEAAMARAEAASARANATISHANDASVPPAPAVAIPVRTTCQKCDSVFSDPRMFALHMRVAHERGACHRCAHCAAIFGCARQLSAHILARHRRSRYVHRCAHCTAVFASRTLLRQHEAAHAATAARRALHRCAAPGCDFVAARPGAMRFHETDRHGENRRCGFEISRDHVRVGSAPWNEPTREWRFEKVGSASAVWPPETMECTDETTVMHEVPLHDGSPVRHDLLPTPPDSPRSTLSADSLFSPPQSPDMSSLLEATSSPSYRLSALLCTPPISPPPLERVEVCVIGHEDDIEFGMVYGRLEEKENESPGSISGAKRTRDARTLGSALRMRNEI